MLSEQGWNILVNEDTLCSRVLRAIYFRGRSFPDANVGNNPLLSWQSIWEAKEVTCRELNWRVWIGHLIYVLNDGWIPDREGCPCQAPSNCVHLYARVRWLID
ncbi:hypothetical protein CFOL_v3_10799 [Cephalotus follicularis]|uniref:Zf-RVT domain-containing protein n=1 Tax=Cephalotus follicularis TaxID=3775 RepID=A0A1Q3BHP6_CEPFO|nr:hypothetical protein CFOL_v3_10799 [Cephalotus follicularis]